MPPPLRTALALAAALAAGCASGPGEELPPPTALELRGEALLREGKVVEAREVFLDAARQGPPRFLALIGVARAAIALRDRPLFEESIRGAMTAVPANAEAMDLVGRTLLLAAKAEAGDGRVVDAALATRFFVQARRLEPARPGLSYHAGLAQLLAGNDLQALTLLERARQEDPESIEVLDALVTALRKNGQRETVRTLLEPLEVSGRLPPLLAPALEWARSAPSGTGAGG